MPSPPDRDRTARNRLPLLAEESGRRPVAASRGERIYVGRVYNAGSMPVAGDRWAYTRPLSIAGDEAEGTAATLVADATRSVSVLVLGLPPVVGDDLVAKLVGGRWVAEKRSPSGGGSGGGGIGLPGCICQGTPATLTLTVTFGVGEDTHTYGNAYQNCTLGYFATAPGYMPSTAFSGAGYYSTTAWIDDYGFTDYFRLSCFSTLFTLGIGQYSGGLWQSPGQIYTWNVGGRGAVNFCSPFGLLLGHNQQGISFNGTFTITG